jgi:hypothetical protein
VLIGRGDITNPGAPYGILAQAMRRLCGLSGGEPEPVQRERLRDRLGRRFAPASAGHSVSFLGELCGVHFPGDESPALQAARNDPRIMHNQVRLAFIEWLRRECQADPVLLVLEDLHWGDALTVQLLEEALRELGDCPLCILALARPEVQELFPEFWNARFIQELPLRPLSRRACERMAQDVLRRALGRAADAQSIERIVNQAAGHPLFLEELIRAVAEGRDNALPETVLTMLIGRLSLLSAGHRQALRAASVFGESFTLDGVAALMGCDSPADTAEPTLEALVRAEFIERRRPSGESASVEFKFRHALVREAAYSLMTDDNRILAHRQACRHLSQIDGTDPAVLADHSYKGQDLEQAGHHYVRAAMQMLARLDSRAAQRHAARALACEVSGVQLGTVRAIQAWASNHLLDLSAAYVYALEAVDMLPPGSFYWCKAIGVLFYSFFLLNRFEHIERLIGAYMNANPEPDDPAAYLEAGAIVGIFFHVGGAVRAADALLAKLTSVTTGFASEHRGHLDLTRGWHLFFLAPDPWGALCSFRQATALFTKTGNRRWLSTSLFGEGMATWWLGSMERAEAALRDARAQAVAIGDTFYGTMIHLHLGIVLAHQAEPSKHAEARSISDAYRDQPGFGTAVRGAVHWILAAVLTSAGDDVGVEVALQNALTSFSALLPYWLAVVPLQVELLLRQSRRAEARRAAEEALHRLDDLGVYGHYAIPVRLAATLARLADGDQEAARAALRKGLTQIELCASIIEDVELRRSYLNGLKCRQIVHLARLHGVPYDPALD